MTKVKILVLGPVGCGKTSISNYLADASNTSLAPELRPTQGARVLEFDVNNLKVQNNNANVEVQLWDVSGDERYMTCWPAIRKNCNGVMFIYCTTDQNSPRKLDLFYNYFVNQIAMSPRQCIVFSNNFEHDTKESEARIVKLSQNFQRISQATINMETGGEKLRSDFNNFLTSVINTMENK